VHVDIDGRKTTVRSTSDLINRAHRILAGHEITWSANQVRNAVRDYQKSSMTTELEEFLAHQIRARTPLTDTTYRRICYLDPTGEEVVRRMSQYVPLKTAAEEVNVSITSLRRYIAQGLITGHRVGPKLIRVDIAEVRAKLLSNTIGGDAA
jgi:hypothetical protein